MGLPPLLSQYSSLNGGEGLSRIISNVVQGGGFKGIIIFANFSLAHILFN